LSDIHNAFDNIVFYISDSKSPVKRSES